MNKRFRVLVALIALVVPFLATTSAQAAHCPEFDYHVADAFIEGGTGIDQTAARARGDAGNVVSVVGEGTFDSATGCADGGGTWEWRKGKGKLVASGEWEATEVQSFTFWGCGEPGLPPNLCGGALALEVDLFIGTDGDPAYHGALTIVCLIGTVPPGAQEGIELDLVGGPDFPTTIEESSGLTVFVQ